MTDKIGISELIDAASAKGFILRVPILCVLLMLTEGMDTFGVGFIGPYLTKQYNISIGALATVYTGTVVASLIGAVICAPLSDRVGRRRMLIATSLIMGPCTILAAFAHNFLLLFLLRFLIGMAFGAALPIAIAMVADYAPKRRKSLFLMMMNTGINLGMVLAGLGAAVIIPNLGWQALLYVSGAVSLIVTVLVCLYLPESLQILAREAGKADQARAIAVRIDPGLASRPNVELVPDKHEVIGGSPVALLQQQRWLTTLILWFLMSLCYVIINYVAYWLPTAMMHAGATISEAGVIISAGKIGGITVAVAVSWLADRRGLPRILTLCFAICAAATTLVGFSQGVPMLAIAFVLVASFMMNANVSGSQALIAGAFPTSLRGTATGWVSGLARLIGGGAGTLLGGRMISDGWSTAQMAPVLGGVLFAAAITVTVFSRLERGPGEPGREAAAVPGVALTR